MSNAFTFLEDMGWTHGYELLSKTLIDAQSDPSIVSKISECIYDGDTDQLRDVFSPYGDYWLCLAHQNAVDALDIALLK